jgi:hypothetical protein
MPDTVKRAARVLAWNVNHRTFNKPVPSTVATAIGALAPDVLVLTEYVPGSDHSRFCGELLALGMRSILMSPREARHDQVLVATRAVGIAAELTGPEIPHAQSNFLHVRIPEHGIEVIGVRVPMFKHSDDTDNYWSWLESFMELQMTRPLVVIGDLNVDPARAHSRSAQGLARIERRGWQRPVVADGWSYCSGTGFHSCLDHVLISPQLHVHGSNYVARHEQHAFAGEADAMSDHAALLVTIGFHSQISAATVDTGSGHR